MASHFFGEKTATSIFPLRYLSLFPRFPHKFHWTISTPIQGFLDKCQEQTSATCMSGNRAAKSSVTLHSNRYSNPKTRGNLGRVTVAKSYSNRYGNPKTRGQTAMVTVNHQIVKIIINIVILFKVFGQLR